MVSRQGLFWLVVVAVLSAIDAGLTNFLFSRGAVELNPLLSGAAGGWLLYLKFPLFLVAIIPLNAALGLISSLTRNRYLSWHFRRISFVSLMRMAAIILLLVISWNAGLLYILM